MDSPMGPWAPPPRTATLPQSHQLQLENEYDIDPAQFQMFHAQDPPADQRYDARQPQAHPPGHPTDSFTQYAQPFAEVQVQPLAYTQPPAQSMPPPYGSSGMLYLGGSSPNPSPNTHTHALQRSPAEPFQAPSHVYAGSPPALPPPFYSDEPHSQGYAYAPAELPLGQRPRAGVSPTFGAQQGYAPGAGQAFPPAGPSGAAYGDLGFAAARMGPYRVPGAAKRMRGMEDGGYDAEDGEGVWEEGGAQGQGDDHEQEQEQEHEHKPKPLGACARCKGLKVRCEFIGDADTCKRCSNGGHECVIPGRKKRKAPPKREVLLSQIRDQAAQISDLMSKLEEANRRASRRASGASQTTPPGGHTNKKRESASLSSADLEGGPLPVIAERASSADVEDWITKARQSIEAFGGYIGMGGPGVTMDMLGDEGSEGSGQSEWEYELNVEDVDAEEGEGEGGYGDAGGEGEGGFVNEQEAESLFGEQSVEGGRGRGQFSRESTEATSDSTSKRAGGSGTQKLATLPNESVPFGLMANLALTKSRRRRSSRGRSDVSAEDASEVGLANDDYFRPSPAPERPIVDEQQQPAILRNGIIKPDEAEKLFAIYYDYMNLSLSLLDPVLYTAQKTYWRSPFLFTAICAVASRYYSPRPELYEQAMKYARLAAGTALIGGQKSVEVVQAYILLSLYPVPSRRWEDDRSFIYLGLAIRVATDLKLHYANTPKTENELHAREMLNRTRTWLNCFNLDRSTGSQYGQRPIIDNMDYVANHTEFWWQSSPYNMEGFDVHTCCYNAELKLVADFRARIYSNPNHPTGLNKEIDLASIASETDDQLARLWETWIVRVRQAETDQQSRFRTGLLKLAFSYARLSVLSVGFQYSFGKASSTDEVPFLWRCLRAASDTVKAVVDEIGIPIQKIYLRHGPEAQSVFVTFASAFLVKLLQPKYAAYLSREQRVEIRELVQRVIDLLGSPEVAIDDRHGPKLYARFLEGLLATPMARVDYSPASIKRNPASPRRMLSKQSSAMSSPILASGTMSARQSLSPPPGTSSTHSSPKPMTPPPMPQANTSLEHSQMSSGTTLYPPLPTGTSDLDTPGFFSPPLFYDTELLQSMQSLTDWPDMVLPGFNWMGSMQTDINSNMRFDQPILGFSNVG